MRRAADERVAFAERQAVADHCPEHRDRSPSGRSCASWCPARSSRAPGRRRTAPGPGRSSSAPAPSWSASRRCLRTFVHPLPPASRRRCPPRSAHLPPAHGPTTASTPSPSPYRNTSPKNASGSLRAEVESGSPDYAGSTADNADPPGQHDTKTLKKQLTGCDGDRGARKM